MKVVRRGALGEILLRENPTIAVAASLATRKMKK
jgi:hypothetical protein